MFFSGSKNCSMVRVSIRPLACRSRKICLASSWFSGASVLCQLSNRMWKPSRYCLRPAAMSATNCCGVLPTFLGRNHDRAPWVSSAPQKSTATPRMRWNRTQVSAWMYSMMWPMWKLPLA